MNYRYISRYNIGEKLRLTISIVYVVPPDSSNLCILIRVICSLDLSRVTQRYPKFGRNTNDYRWHCQKKWSSVPGIFRYPKYPNIECYFLSYMERIVQCHSSKLLLSTGSLKITIICLQINKFWKWNWIYLINLKWKWVCNIHLYKKINHFDDKMHILMIEFGYMI